MTSFWLKIIAFAQLFIGAAFCFLLSGGDKSVPLYWFVGIINGVVFGLMRNKP